MRALCLVVFAKFNSIVTEYKKNYMIILLLADAISFIAVTSDIENVAQVATVSTPYRGSFPIPKGQYVCTSCLGIML